MSSAYVRSLVRTWLQDSAMVVPFYNTINEEQKPSDDNWCTVHFNNPYREVTTFCEGDWVEEGEAEIVYFGLPGVSDTNLIQLIEADMTTLMAKRDPNEKLVLMNRSAPIEYSSGSAGLDYALAIYVDYTFYS